MPDVLQTSSAWLESMRDQFRTNDVTYSADGTPTVVKATVGRSEFEMVDSNGVVMRVDSRDYLITASQLSVEPKAGHRIADGGNVYEVSEFGSEPAWRWSDPFHQTYRIHTKKVKA